MKPSEIIADNTLLYKLIIEKQNLYEAYDQFLQQNPKTQLKIKDIETVMRFMLSIQISSLLSNKTLIKDIFDNSLNVDIDVTKLVKLENEQIVEYILELFLNRYLPAQ